MRTQGTADDSSDVVARFAEAHNGLVEFLAGCSDAEWQTMCDREGRPVGVVAHHVAGGYLPIMDMIEARAAGRPAPDFDWDTVHSANARHAAENRDVRKAETMRLLEQNGEEVTRRLGGLSHEELQRTAPSALVEGREISGAELAELFMIGHARNHLASIREAVGR